MSQLLTGSVQTNGKGQAAHLVPNSAQAGEKGVSRWLAFKLSGQNGPFLIAPSPVV
ncbi:hypothetical protein [Paenibacillus apiarius]|uniref:Uncharacterized protein n=1 Tax=Paenibacillus apiarius TaxID=46240 RepID=A0ABT4DQW9_9BACL|nr:hypothetical protein [Paenibacillus apiarius]MBN3523202.1 hypothetical protein [Paenibacillus apiarius]MCY9516223.1 hypothetical protein [Paenibacillus apiarius]MCY9519757.1 hypothetical protein [Paenibacillus apiarius]MCY9555283.1 hypothetical protein [Paenibacillus apiarius]MCY9559358.1 hypothetical protein [Paenibacillus apiarius]